MSIRFGSILVTFLVFVPTLLFSEGSKNLTPAFVGNANEANTWVGYLEHDFDNDPSLYGFDSGSFLGIEATADERVYIHIRNGETLYFGLRRLLALLQVDTDYEDLHILLFDAASTEVGRWTIEGSGAAAFPAGQGVIDSYESVLAGPEQIVLDGSGYDALQYTNNTGTDQDFYVAFVQNDVTADDPDIDVRSWYDLWDFSVYDGQEEKPGRLFCKRWNFSTGASNATLSTDFQLFARIPSTVDGIDGSYVKGIDISGMEPFSLAVYANSQGSTTGADFTLQRQSQNAETALLEYDIFVNNPDIEIYPTTALPSVDITDSYFNCSGAGGAAVINFNTNQTGLVAIILDLNGQSGYQPGTTDVIIEDDITAVGSFAIQWDGLDGLGATVASGTQIRISGRFTTAALHVPLWDVEENDAGIRMTDVRPSTSFDLIYWDDSGLAGAGNGSAPNDVELTGSDVNTHTWGGNPGDQLGNNILTNTWSYGYYQINTQTIDFIYDCDVDGDGVTNNVDADGDNDGLSDEQEGYTNGAMTTFDYKGDDNANGIPNYLDPAFDSGNSFVDSNGDGVNDNFDTDLDGVPDALDIDSDNDGIPDLVEVGLTDTDNDGRLPLPLTDGGTPNGWEDTYDDSQGGTPINLLSTANDRDGDGVSNYIDLDSDNDGLVDAYEAGGTAGNNGQIDVFTDSDGNGRNDNQDVGALPIPDTDADGTLPNYLDIDSDNDGIPDNSEAQASSNSIATAAGDTNGNGLLDVYDPTVQSGTLLIPVDTDADTNPDYLDLDSDDDGVADVIEGYDSNANGIGDWETGSNNDVTDEAGHGTDSDTDGLYDVFEGGAVLQNTDNAGLADWQDSDDDNDGILTTGEDTDDDGDWTNDFTQGGGLVPDYLYRGDSDGDGIADASDLDDDNDGILDSVEGTNDSDGDGLPNNLDLDSDGDGILDAVEANNGAVPNNWNASTGQFNLNDPDEDGLMNAIDNTPGADGGNSTLANPNFDSDPYADMLDIDSDGDGLTDFIEAVASGSTLTAAGIDEDGDGIDDAFDPNQGGTLVVPINTDGSDNPDYRDLDSDNDGVEDLREGDDADNDGYGDWDANENGSTDELFSDSDNDGLDDYFDTFVEWNAIGSSAARQNTDGVDQPDHRDTDDDNDGVPTSGEGGVDGDWTNDFTDGGSPIPDYLFFGDFDGDGQPNADDDDSDNDGIPDLEEDIEGTSVGAEVDPSADANANGIPNYRDPDTPTGLDDDSDSNDDGVYDIFDSDLDGLPNFLDSDSDNDGISDIIEAGGVNDDQDGQVDDPTDSDNDGFADTFDSDDDGTALPIPDSDGDGIRDFIDRDSDNDGLPDSIESGGTDADGDGILDDLTDFDSDGFADASDNSNPILVDTDGDLVLDIHDKDSDNDGVTDTVENGGADTDGDGNIDGYQQDADGDGLADTVDPDDMGVPLSLADFDGDGIPNARDLDSDNDGYQDILEAEGSDTDNDGIVNSMLDTDGDGVPDIADVDILSGGANDADDDEIDDLADVDQVANSDDDGDGIINAFDPDANGDGYADDVRISPWFVPDFDGDGLRNYLDLDSDGDGIVDVVEFGLAANTSNGQIALFLDATMNGWNDAQEPAPGGAMPITPVDTDGRALPVAYANYIDLDADDDGIPDLIEAQNSASFIAPSGLDVNNNGLDDAYDPNNPANASLIELVDTDLADVEDYLDDDSDNDNVPDVIEGSNAGRGQYADWDTNDNNDVTDESGYNEDTDDDGFLDVFDNVEGPNPLGTNAAVQDTDGDGIDDFQDINDDNDAESTANEDDSNMNGDPTDDFSEGGPFPDYLYVQRDADGDGINDDLDLDADSDGLLNILEDGNVGLDPSGDIDFDGLLNYEDNDMDGDDIPNVSDSDADGSGGADTWSKVDSNNDGVIDVFDTDLDSVPDFLDRDSDNDGISDAEELSATTGFTDTDLDGQIDDESGYDDSGTPDGADDHIGSITPPDDDSDGVPNHLDLDSDNDGITDNVEGQSTADYRAPELADDDNDGILNVYDVNNVGAISPIDSDPDLIPDYLDQDSDNDGVLDYIEGFDSNADGFTDLDSNDDNEISNETGYGVDTDGDGIFNLFDTVSAGFATVSNINGSNQVLQNTDGADELDFRDTDDDNDATDTSLEDTSDGMGGSGDMDWTNDFSQGGSGVPDYLFSPDNDSDGVPDASDADADNDGIPNSSEYSIGTDPFVINGGLYNYRNPSGAGLTDSNGDDIADEYDQDLDGVPDFFDLDSDNDGVSDAVEANNGIVPPFDFDVNTGRFTSSTDVDLDGLVVTIDTDDNNSGITTSTLSNPNTDGDGPNDFQDLDSDNDGIPDNIEAQATASYVAPSGNDMDGDGWDDSYDGSAIAIVNTDGADVVDYLDQDSDNDDVGDIIEGHDTNSNGDADWAVNSNNNPFDVAGYNNDTDGDGVWSLFDSYSGSGINNINGSTAAIQDTDEDNIPDYRDPDDDNDGLPTSSGGTGQEDENDNDIFNDDFNQGGGATPNYLFAGGDTDGDGFADSSDLDADNDGIPDAIENTTSPTIDPFGDVNANGIYNYLDAASVGLTDSNADGVADEFDFDLDGVPNFLDLDSDNDGIPDHLEAGGSDDGNDDGIIDSFGDNVPVGGDGLDDDLNTTPLPFHDTDGDGQPDFLDIDSDNDGITDLIEAGGIDSNGNGFGDTPGDSDGDGMLNIFDPDEMGVTPLTVPDTDADGIRNYLDADSDNDGLPDIVEGGAVISDGDGQVDNPADDDNDGLDDDFDVDAGGSVPSVPDTDGDGLRDFIDLDSDNDGIPDVAEANQGVFPAVIVDFEGMFPYSSGDDDTDQDGLVNNVDEDNSGTAFSPTNTDGDGTPDYLDTDSDGDGAPDYFEAFDDDEDADNDVTDDLELRGSNFGPPYNDLTDTNADGIRNWLEGNPPAFLNPNNATYYLDANANGLVDLFDASSGGLRYGGTMNGYPDAGNNGTPNHLDAGDVISLPIELVWFRGTSENGLVKLTWQTSSELNNAKFEIDRSQDGIEFEKIGTVLGEGNSQSLTNYHYLDEQPVEGRNYYRLRQIDFDGRPEIVGVILVQVDQTVSLDVQVYPNPVTAKLNISVRSNEANVFINASSLSGTTIYQDSFRKGFGGSQILLNTLHWESGVYVIKVKVNREWFEFKVVR